MAHNKVKRQHYNRPQEKQNQKPQEKQKTTQQTNKQTKQEKGELLAVSKVPEIAGSLLWNFLTMEFPRQRSRNGSE